MFALCSCVVLVKVCYACDVFDNAAFGRVMFKTHICVCFVSLCCPCEGVLSSCVFDNAAFGRVTFESSIMCYSCVVVLCLSRCIVLVKVSRDTEVSVASAALSNTQ